eukprot:1138104-Pelagomonas_calceolata.AAC.2
MVVVTLGVLPRGLTQHHWCAIREILDAGGNIIPVSMTVDAHNHLRFANQKLKPAFMFLKGLRLADKGQALMLHWPSISASPPVVKFELKTPVVQF